MKATYYPDARIEKMVPDQFWIEEECKYDIAAMYGESSHWQYKFPLPVEGVPTAKRMEIPLPGVCTAMMKKLPVKDRWQLH
nr:hypothetical protein [Tanacetum cinerariifolium]